MINETPEIANLTARIAKDPRSRLFVLLAEEHKKSGNLEMAIHVLLQGLQNNPDYITARTFLGKLLLAKGDFSGAQKEFQEVLTAMPDNVMAQRSLGDLHILQNRPHDALAYYNAALSLNPQDEELTSLIVDVEAGRDVRTKVQLTEIPSAPTSLMTESVEEIPEEVLIVEPLESEAFALEPAKLDDAFSRDPQIETVPSVTAEESYNFDFSSQSHEEQETALKDDNFSEQDLFQEPDAVKSLPNIFEETGSESFFESAEKETIAEKAPEKTTEDSSDKSDDFTTDTLAELYIAQGFYEKAIEIYERMLSDKPNSRGLQDKLAGVRALAAQSIAPLTAEKKAADLPVEAAEREYLPANASSDVPEEPSVFDEPKEYWPQQNAAPEGLKPEAFAEAREYIPPSATDELMMIDAEILPEPGEFNPGEPSPEDDVFAEFSTRQGVQVPAGGDAVYGAAAQVPDRVSARVMPQDTDFEPREYIPPKQAMDDLEPSAAKGKAVQTPSSSGRKETIARLETWLINIKKEK